ncbi:hypothetical protein AUJ14_05915 [Candidatus Micrarchaeota archaeon CG1_02_55_22]|nr:MAG: hypothetical protein AUJ14_05915 [Candidatus Micrarchaeota archaeon CG1_02_55_22]
MNGLLRLAVIGSENSGKSTLTFAFGNYVRKQGLSCELGNFDAGCKRAKYKATFDIRHHHALSKRTREEHVEVALKKIYTELADDDSVRREITDKKASIVILDCRGGAELFLSNGPARFLKRYADAVLLVFDSTECATESEYALHEGLAKLVSKATGVKCTAVANKYVSRDAPTQTRLLSIPTPIKHAEDGVLRANAVEGTGFRELFKHVARML